MAETNETSNLMERIRRDLIDSFDEEFEMEFEDANTAAWPGVEQPASG